MSIKYYYVNSEYNTENEAQDAATKLSVRMQNNPNDWIKVKEITGSNETGWLINPTLLTDAQILNPDTKKTYTCFSKYNGENVIPITATQLISKNNEYRKIYGQFWKVNTIEKVENDGVNEPTAVVITPTTDMSEYV
jgi:hypothetical protein|tara:strand:+ start:1623 stop:2033 length:411 start_codon:yes stop_codon:yes gene_type:complete